MLKKIGWLILLSLAAPALAGAEPFRGESCEACHAKLKSTALPSASSEKDAGSYDVIVIGGGLSGLAAAHWLRDLNVLVLEKESQLGGHARGVKLKGGLAPAADIVSDLPYGALADLMEDEGVSFSSVAVRDSLFVSSGNYVDNWLGGGVDKLPYSDDVKESLKRLGSEVRRLRDSGSMTIPVESSKLAPLRIFDPVSFAKYLEDSYGPEVAKLGDLYARDTFGITADQISAYAGLFFLQSELSTAYSGRGGAAALAEALAREVSYRAVTGGFVWRVHQTDAGVRVEFDRKGKPYAATAKAVVFALPGLVAAKIIEDLSPGKRRALNALRYSTYVVVPFSVFHPLPVDTLKLWNANAYFTTLAFPEQDAEVSGQTIVAYVPFGGEPGRRRLEVVSDAGIRAHVEGDLDKMFPGASGDVREIQVIRWGHGMSVPFPKFLTEVRPAAARPEKRYFFAGEDTQLPCLQGAAYAGYLAAQKVRAYLGAKPLSSSSVPSDAETP